jgi:pyruvate dehydrogenase E2 component (dihydrolipoamide acetyltransferase)
MPQQVNLPVLGDTTKYAVILEWVVNVGDHVDEGATLMRVETDKAVVEVPSPVSGTLLEQLVAVEDEIDVGAPIAVIDGSD